MEVVLSPRSIGGAHRQSAYIRCENRLFTNYSMQKSKNDRSVGEGGGSSVFEKMVLLFLSILCTVG